ncbi:isoleucine--tRNA ligase, partial [Candidatus Berkelbacteria bacterium]|nr:isoleucine--tRNA ligase [Candidatus Berkelbacteria bacterium]
GFLFKGQKTVPYCPRCQTPLSSFELAQGYAEAEDPSVYLRFKIQNSKSYNLPPNTSFLVWTTTPWTLPGNVALVVNPAADYVILRHNDENLILAKDRLEIFGTGTTVVKQVKGKDLVGLKYEPLYQLTDHTTAYQVYSEDFVSLEEGTGIVHIAPAFGEDDFELSQKRGLPLVNYLDREGKFSQNIAELNIKGTYFKEADAIILDNLASRGFLFKSEKITHTYPFCWRCSTPLIYQVMDSWFIKMSSLRKELIAANQKINWIPGHLKQGRFGEWLKEAKDWAISRQRFWGTPLPIWICQKCGEKMVVGSISELKKKAFSFPKTKELDLHRPFVDEIVLKCEKCNGQAKRVEEVIDVWFDSGAMPFAVKEYPDFYPADYIAEGIDQTRGWFYTLLAVATALSKERPYKNVLSHGLVLDEKGLKMSKSRGNMVEPGLVLERFGADALRFYFYTATQIGENIRFSFEDLRNSANRWQRFFRNSFLYLKIKLASCQSSAEQTTVASVKHILDQWLLSEYNLLIREVTNNFNQYKIVEAARQIENFLEMLSNWYVRRSRGRFTKGFFGTLKEVLLGTSKLLAPLTPFLSEEVWQGLRAKEMPFSVHLSNWPKAKEKLINPKLNQQMAMARQLAEAILGLRSKAGIKVRQPLAVASFEGPVLGKSILEIVAAEVNVLKIRKIKTSPEFKVKLDTKMTAELKQMGLERELIRQIMDLRKGFGYQINDRLLAKLEPKSKALSKLLKDRKNKIAASARLELVLEIEAKHKKEILVNEEPITISLA